MNLKEFVNSMPQKVQIKLALHFLEIAIPIWNRFANNITLSYRDTVVGLQHNVRVDLLIDTFKLIQIYNNENNYIKRLFLKSKIKKLEIEFRDPIVSLQDTDWEIPDNISLIFYSVNNLLEFVLGKELTAFNDTYIYISINQSIDAIEKSNILTYEEINMILKEFKNENI